VTPRSDERDRRVLETVRRFIEEHGYPPTVRQVAAELGLQSASGAHTSLIRLRDAGRVTWVIGQPRTLRVVTMEEEEAE
jgi:repressor LexA